MGGSPAEWSLASLRSTSAADSLSLLCQLGFSGDARAAQAPARALDSALIFAARVREGTRGVAALSSCLTDDARRLVADALDAWAAGEGAASPSPTSSCEAMAYIELF
jgi:hypothetical protein